MNKAETLKTKIQEESISNLISDLNLYSKILNFFQTYHQINQKLEILNLIGKNSIICKKIKAKQKKLKQNYKMIYKNI